MSHWCLQCKPKAHQHMPLMCPWFTCGIPITLVYNSQPSMNSVYGFCLENIAVVTMALSGDYVHQPRSSFIWIFDSRCLLYLEPVILWSPFVVQSDRFYFSSSPERAQNKTLIKLSLAGGRKASPSVFKSVFRLLRYNERILQYQLHMEIFCVMKGEYFYCSPKAIDMHCHYVFMQTLEPLGSQTFS